MMRIKNEPNNRDTWYKLDLSANVYPTLQRKDFSSVYRISVTLKEDIQPDLLQQALDMTLPRFPTFKVAMRRGFSGVTSNQITVQVHLFSQISIILACQCVSEQRIAI